MARKAGGGQSTGAYFRELFETHLDWLEAGNNDAVREQWKKDHDGDDMNESQKGIMANIKSIQRKRLGIGGSRPGRKPGRKPKAEGALVGAAPVTVTVSAPRSSSLTGSLEQLEIAIDHCLSTARRLDPERLDKVIKYLREARNGVVLTLG